MTSVFSSAEISYSSTPLTAASSSKSSLRSDARQPLAYRDITIQTSIGQSSIGSARVIVDSLAGSTEICAGVRGEVEDISTDQGHDPANQGMGKVVVSVECSPTALPSLLPDLTLHLASLLSDLFSPTSLPRAFLSALLVIPHTKAWTLYLDILILSSAGGNVIDLAIMAARSALAVTRVPATRSIGYEKGEVEVGAELQEQSGISGLVKGGKAGANAVDFELIDGGWEDGERLAGWQDLPVGLTLNLINQLPHLDATILEESATASQVVFCFTSEGDVCGLKQIGAGEIEYARLMPLLAEARKHSAELIQVLNKRLEKDV